MNETILTELVEINTMLTDSEGQKVFGFPEIQKKLDEGFSVKQIFYTPLKRGYTDYSTLALTVHLVKPE